MVELHLFKQFHEDLHLNYGLLRKSFTSNPQKLTRRFVPERKCIHSDDAHFRFYCFRSFYHKLLAVTSERKLIQHQISLLNKCKNVFYIKKSSDLVVQWYLENVLEFRN